MTIYDERKAEMDAAMDAVRTHAEASRQGTSLEMLLDLAAVQAALNEGDEAPWMVGSLSVFSRVTHAHA